MKCILILILICTELYSGQSTSQSQYRIGHATTHFKRTLKKISRRDHNKCNTACLRELTEEANKLIEDVKEHPFRFDPEENISLYNTVCKRFATRDDKGVCLLAFHNICKKHPSPSPGMKKCLDYIDQHTQAGTHTSAQDLHAPVEPLFIYEASPNMNARRSYAVQSFYEKLKQIAAQYKNKCGYECILDLVERAQDEEATILANPRKEPSQTLAKQYEMEDLKDYVCEKFTNFKKGRCLEAFYDFCKDYPYQRADIVKCIKHIETVPPHTLFQGRAKKAQKLFKRRIGKKEAEQDAKIAASINLNPTLNPLIGVQQDGRGNPQWHLLPERDSQVDRYHDEKTPPAPKRSERDDLAAWHKMHKPQKPHGGFALTNDNRLLDHLHKK